MGAELLDVKNDFSHKFGDFQSHRRFQGQKKNIYPIAPPIKNFVLEHTLVHFNFIPKPVLWGASNKSYDSMRGKKPLRVL